MIVFMMGVKTVPQQQAWIVESLGKFDRKLEPGLNILDPVLPERRLQAFAQGKRHRGAGAGGHHARQRDADAGRHSVCAHYRSGGGVLWREQPDLRRAAAGADDHALGNRQADARQNLRGTRNAERQHRHRHQPGGADLGHPVHAL